MMGVVVGGVVFVSFLCIGLLPIFPKLIFFHFCWKDIYILLMFKQLWSMIHSTIPPSRAKYLYGIIFAIGPCGATLGSLVPGFLAIKLGSTSMFLFTFPVYSLLFYAYAQAYRRSGITNLKNEISLSTTRTSEGFSLIARSRYLTCVLCLVILMQISVALIEYQFSYQLEINFPIKDLRTAYTGQLMSLLSFLSLCFQCVGSFVLIKILGLRGSHYSVPILLFSVMLSQLFNPGFGMISFAYVAIKLIDFSIFGVIREMLFIPLSIREKFCAKAVIDVFAYRTSKALISLVILGAQFWIESKVFVITNYIFIGIFFIWLIILALLFRVYKSLYIPSATQNLEFRLR